MLKFFLLLLMAASVAVFIYNRQFKVEVEVATEARGANSAAGMA